MLLGHANLQHENLDWLWEEAIAPHNLGWEPSQKPTEHLLNYFEQELVADPTITAQGSMRGKLMMQTRALVLADELRQRQAFLEAILANGGLRPAQLASSTHLRTALELARVAKDQATTSRAQADQANHLAQLALIFGVVGALASLAQACQSCFGH